jgi:hypothetical protein
MPFKERQNKRKDVSGYWFALRKREDTGSRKVKYWISRYGEFALEVSTEMSQEKQRNEWILSQVEAAKSLVKIQFVKKRERERERERERRRRRRSWGIRNKHRTIFLKRSFSLL